MMDSDGFGRRSVLRCETWDCRKHRRPSRGFEGTNGLRDAMTRKGIYGTSAAGFQSPGKIFFWGPAATRVTDFSLKNELVQ
jgi:hypothetical protein